MDNRFIVNLRGRANCGKTTTLKQLYSLLTDKESSGAEIKEVFRYRDTKIGVFSCGDLGECVNKNMKDFIDQQCDIIVCASRTKGGSSDEVYTAKKSAGYNLITVGPVYSSNQNQMNLCKSNQANSLKNLIDSLIENQ